jgi:NAD-dependent dihydropyrimidine dehydrogenase PreA subunit
MAYVISLKCIGTKDRSCVEVCPVDCFYNYKNPKLNKKYGRPEKDGDSGMLVINPDECINCGACETECPVEAIYEDSGMPEELKEFIQQNDDAIRELALAEGGLDAYRVTSKT